MKPIGVIALPRDPNPYQRALYDRLAHCGFRVRFGGEFTRSRTVNLLALPLELAIARIDGFRILHIHWTFGFTLAGSRSRFIRRLSRLWFGVVLHIAHALGMRIVWTAHNLLPHAPVFDDDRAARRTLIEATDLVIAHSQATLDAIGETFGRPRRSAVIAHGPLAPSAVRSLDGPHPSDRRKVLFIGNILAYKGVDDLVEAARRLESHQLEVRIAGSCTDPELSDRLTAGAAGAKAVHLELGYVPDDSLASLLDWADAVVYPFRSATTSGSVTLAMAAGRGLIVPELAAFAELPAKAVVRYEPGVDGLTGALAAVAAMPDTALAAMGRASRTGLGNDWTTIAQQTAAQFNSLVARPA